MLDLNLSIPGYVQKFLGDLYRQVLVYYELISSHGFYM
jgi:hypothetical protein